MRQALHLPKLIVEMTVKPLKAVENVVTFENNKKGSKERRGGKSEMKEQPAQTQQGGN